MTDEIKVLKEKADHVSAQIKEMAEHEEKSLKLTMGVKVFVALFIAAYLGWAYYNIKSIDADLVVFTAVERVNESIPMAKKKIAERLLDMAPGVLDQAQEQALTNLPKISAGIREASKEALIGLADEHEKDILGWIAEFIGHSREFINENFPGQNSYEKITAMRKYVLEDVQNSLEGVGYEIGDSVKENSIVPQLRRLLKAKDLTEKEKIQRDVIALAYLLVQKNLDDLGI